jgi:hypothetical protein
MGALTGRVFKKNREYVKKIPTQIRKESTVANLPKRSSLKVLYQSVSYIFMHLFDSEKIGLREILTIRVSKATCANFPVFPSKLSAYFPPYSSGKFITVRSPL